MDLNEKTIISLTAPQTITLVANVASTGVAITNKYFRMTSTVDGFYLTGASNVATAAATGHRITANVPYDIRMTLGGYVSFFSTSAGTVYISEIVC